MKKIKLNVLDAYAARLTENQVTMLYENKCHKKYTKVLYENMVKPTKYNLYLDEYTMASDLNANKVEVIMHLNKKYPELMESISYKIDSNSIDFNAKDKQHYDQLTSILADMGVEMETLHEMRAKNLC